MLALLGLLALAAEAAVPNASAQAEEPSPVALLERMGQALTELEYEGTLVYLNGHELSTLRIAHRIDGGQVRESLLALSGPIRAVARSRKTVTCVLPDARAISVPRQHPGALTALAPGPLDLQRLQRHYLIHPLGRSRIAGRDTRVVGIIPRDELRYGYRFFIDDETGLPLKTDLMDNQATPIEQVMFTEVEFIRPNPSATAAASASPAGLSARSSAVAQLETPALGVSTPPAPAPAQAQAQAPAQASPSAKLDISPWRLSSLPDGFRLVAADPTVAVDGGERRWLMISDGLSTVSVYIEPDRGRGLAGQEQVGAVHAAGRVIGGQQVTVVGEAPALTVDAIADALSLGD
jgi:sigma-E factor negative regulatory protein RseB